ncbi:MAG: hypothetical protein MZV64_33865 [Ignavibacteriales bacterium]|nr:hypothetical protein [Ignavibacteriales bacterium]
MRTDGMRSIDSTSTRPWAPQPMTATRSSSPPFAAAARASGGAALTEGRPGQGGAEPGRGRRLEEIPAADPPGRGGLGGMAHGVTPASVEAGPSYYKRPLSKKRGDLTFLPSG